MSLQTQLSALITAIGADIKALKTSDTGGWFTCPTTLAYSSADSPTFVATTGANVTGTISVGMKIRLTQTTTKYFIVTAISSTTITLYGGTDYTLANAAISAISYSIGRTPYGFPASQAKWTVTIIDSVDHTLSNPSPNTWYTLGSTFSIPIGAWIPRFRTPLAVSGDNPIASLVAISPNNNTATHDYWQEFIITTNGVGGQNILNNYEKEVPIIEVAAKTTWYWNFLTRSSGVWLVNQGSGSYSSSMIYLACAYL